MNGYKRKQFLLAILALLSALFLSALQVILLSTHAFAQTDINIDNQNIIRLGEAVTISSNQVAENAIAIGGTVTVEPGGRVTQTAIAVGGDVVLEEGSRVDGDAYAVGGQVIREEGATVEGSVGTLENMPWRYGRRGPKGGFNAPIYFLSAIFRFFTALLSAIIGVLLLQWRPDFLPTLSAIARQYPGRSALWGVGGILVLIALNILLIITLLGIPLVPLVNLLASILMWIGALGIVLLVGQQIWTSPRRTIVQQFLMGVLIVGLISLVPIVGGLVLAIINILGLGALLAWQIGKVHPQTPYP